MLCDARQVWVILQSALFQWKMTTTYSYKRINFPEARQWTQSHSHHGPLYYLLKTSKPFYTIPRHSLWIQWAFLIQAKDSYLGNSIQFILFTIFCSPFIFQSVCPFSPPVFSFSIGHNSFLPVVFRCLNLGKEIGCGVLPVLEASHLAAYNSFSNLFESESLNRHPLPFLASSKWRVLHLGNPPLQCTTSWREN